MRLTSMALFGLAGLGMLAVPPASGATVMKPSLPLLRPPGVHAGPGPQPHRRGRTVPPGGCTSNELPRFIGIAGIGIVPSGDFAGFYSGVLSGYANEACSNNDAIAGGASNVIGALGDGGAAQESIIGSGDNNAIASAFDFIGAGQHNGVSNDDSVIGAGTYNTETGGSSFIGAGWGNTGSGSYAFVGAGLDNAASALYSFVGAGTSNAGSADHSFVGAGANNAASGSYSFVGAGVNNVASGLYSFIGAGENNVASGPDTFVVGGYANTAYSGYSFVGGGLFNNARGVGSFIGGGDYVFSLSCNPCSTGGNTVAGSDSFIGAGDQNSVSANEAFVGGGGHNAIAGSAGWGTIGGGHDNTVAGTYATIPGGAENTAAGVLSLAAGYHADATRTGSFVWSDYVSGSSVVRDSAPDQFVVRASGGTYLYSSENLQSGVKLAAGSGTWASLSDRNSKTDVASLDDAAVLAKVSSLPVSTWRYKTETGVRHVGPMAQDFYAAFGVGEDDRHITSIDEDGVALAAIKALHDENARLRDRLAALEKKVEALSAR